MRRKIQIHSSFSKSLMVGSGGQNSESDESDPSVVECPVGYNVHMLFLCKLLEKAHL